MNLSDVAITAQQFYPDNPEAGGAELQRFKCYVCGEEMEAGRKLVCPACLDPKSGVAMMCRQLRSFRDAERAPGA